ncbi:hypothetical protein [Roseimicrobium sp. ORNL1]|uniref:hypothetical protein n=1 Tax=Roseimicrobium sp. ORNL1 TaxID=2711231 RepID=UPI0013E1902D|nr:hypothetical protein [Roseimicrobium sp. ORNL1]QIF01079.1 hypothetical protein G5S37_05945 [Roseimicrobium sp. ORNL1]
MKSTLRSLTAIVALALATTTHAADPALPASLLAEKAPKDAVSVVKARENAKPGEAVVLRGKIGGRKIALLPKFAMAVLADEKAITSCNDMPGDSCKTPWDYCCESPEKLSSSTATIQVRDEKGKILRTPLRGLGELKELSLVVISGTVDPASTKDNLIVNATSIFVEKP